MTPEWIATIWLRVKALLKRRQLDRDLREELRFHLAMRQEKYEAAGMTPEDADAAARRRFGNSTRFKEACREMWTFAWLEALAQDLRFGLRQLRRNPGFTAVAIITLALGIGANSAVFSVVNSVLLRPLVYPNSDRLVWLSNYDLYFRQEDYGPLGDYRIWKKQARSFESMTAYGNQDLTLVSDQGAAQERIASIAGDFWSITGARPALGRLFGPAAQHTIVLSHGLFERRFGSDPHIIGGTVTLNGYPFTVTGVLQPKFRFLFPQEFSVDEPRDIDAYIPFPNVAVVPGQPIYFPGEAEKYGPAPNWVCVVGKLGWNASVALARAQMETIYARIARDYPGPIRTYTILRVVPLRKELVSGARPALMVLLGSVAFVLLIAIVNVANLLLARASSRQKETAIRKALGAGHLRMLRQFLAESILLAFLGGAAGLLLARWALVIMIRLGSEIIPRLGEANIDGRVLLFTLAISLATGVLFGLAPTLYFWRGSLHEALNDDARLCSSGAGPIRARGVLVAVELALATVLLGGAGLMLKSFWRMNAYPPGFVPEKILVMRVSLSGPQYNVWLRQDAYIRELMRRIRTIPGVQAVGVDRATLHFPFKVEGAQPNSPKAQLVAGFRAVSPGFLRAIGVQVIKGRLPPNNQSFDDLVVNESFVRAIFKNGDPIGARINAKFLKGVIVGVIADFKYHQLDAVPSPAVYFPYQLSPVGRSIRVIVRTSADPRLIAPAIRKLASQIDPTQPVYDLTTLEQTLSDSIAPRSFNLLLLATFAAVALMMALVGIHGVISYSVAQRTHEIGIRMALGAQKSDVLGLVVASGMGFALAGVGIGLMGALALTRFLSSLLYAVKPTDPLTFVAVTLILIGVALLACYVPARRAAKVDPMVALRYE